MTSARHESPASVASGFPRTGNVLVLGLGASGVAASKLLRAQGRCVCALDAAAGESQQRAAEELRALGVDARPGAEETLPSLDFSCAVASPGLSPKTSSWLKELARRGVPVWPEFEWGWEHRGHARVLAITGSNGKSTAVKLLAESLALVGRRVAIAGNYGPPVCKIALEQPGLDAWVLEISSFQLELMRAFRPDIAVLLNVQPNHLDRHGTLEEYRRIKGRIFERSGPGDTCIVPPEEVNLCAAPRAAGARVDVFSHDAGSSVQWDRGVVRCAQGSIAVEVRDTYFDNPILGLACAAVVGAVESLGVDPECVSRAARVFQPLPHRLQTVAEARGVRWIDDSKATSMTALLAALDMLGGGRRIRLLAGGRAKEKDFSPAKEKLAFFAKKIYLYGECAGDMHRAWSDAAPCVECGDLSGAVRQAGLDARSGEVVLLSPACTSFDQFKNFEERGEFFTQLARRWSGMTNS